MNQVGFVPPAGAELRGSLTLQLLIAPDGAVRDATVLTVGRPLDVAVVDAALQNARPAVYAPTIVDGVAHPLLLKYAFSAGQGQMRTMTRH